MSLKEDNAAVTKRVAELEVQVKQLNDIAESLRDKVRWSQHRSDEQQNIIDNLQSELAWTPVRDGLPTEDGAYEFIDMQPSGSVKMFDLWVRRNGSWKTDPVEHWDYNWFRRVELPKGGES